MPHDHDHAHDPDGVVIGLREIYDEIRTVAMQHVEIRAKLDTAIQMHTLQIDSLKDQLASATMRIIELEKRVAELERRPSVSPKAITAVVSVAIAAASVIVGIVAIIAK